jgi:hypothetical protein
VPRNGMETGNKSMRPEARKRLMELRWLVEAERYLRKAREDLAANPRDRQLAALIETVEEVIETERSRYHAA